MDSLTTPRDVKKMFSDLMSLKTGRGGKRVVSMEVRLPHYRPSLPPLC